MRSWTSMGGNAADDFDCVLVEVLVNGRGFVDC
jgi:hypothetical protein